MKILFLTDQVYLHGGIEKVLSQKVNYLVDIFGYEITVVTYRQQNRIPIYNFNEKIRFIDLGVNYYIGKSYFHPANLGKIPRHFLRLKEVFERIQPDIVVSSSFGPDFYFIPNLKKHIPKVKEFHSSRYFYNFSSETFKEKLLHRLTHWAESRYHQLVVLNNSEKQYYNNANISVIPNPAEQSTLRANPASKQMMAAGRISPVKNFEELITAFSRVARDFPDWELHFYGADYLGTQKQLESRIAELDLENQVKFKGAAPNLKLEMQNYSLYAMTSESECFPMVLLEALSVGLPVISYDSPTGPKHILTDQEDSFLVPYKNLDIFVAKLHLLMHDEKLRHVMGENAIENVQRFRIETVMHSWKNLFISLGNTPQS